MVRNNHILVMTAIVLPFVSLGYAYDPDPDDFATQVIEYVEGSGVPTDFLSGIKFNDPEAALGRPTVDTTGDGFDTGPPTQPVPVLPINPPLRYFELVSIGEGGHLIVKFNHPVVNDPKNPCGLDLIIFGNTSQLVGGGSTWKNGNPNDTIVQTSDVWSEPGIVSVSKTGPPDDYDWHTFPAPDGPYADTFAPTLGRIYDPDNPDPALGAWNEWWGQATYPTIPFNPALSPADFYGKTVAEYAYQYGYCTGGTGFDLDELGLDWIRYVKVENPSGSGITPEIDALADVDPDIAPPDFDCDTDVDHDDLSFFKTCVTGAAVGPVSAGCERADLDNDGDVDQTDFGLFQRCISGADIPANPECRE